jgi:hypothetical protein
MSNAAVQDEAEDRYHTQIDAGDVRLFTLDQLDAAFNAGLIHENTYVCLEGGSEWLTLGEVAGLGDDEEPVSAPQLIAQPVPQPRSYAAPSTSAPYSVAPMVAPSLRPVVNDLSFDDDDFEMMAMRPKRRLGKVVAAVAVLGLAGLGFAVVQSGGLRLPKLDLGAANGQAAAASLTLSSLKDSSSPAAAKPATPAPAPEPAKPEPPKAEEAKPSEAATTTPTSDKAADKASSDSAEAGQAKKSDDRFSEEMKAALLNKDKKQAVDQKHKKAARTAVAAKRVAAKAGKAGKGGGGFKAGGSAYDPLNGKL